MMKAALCGAIRYGVYLAAPIYAFDVYKNLTEMIPQISLEYMVKILSLSIMFVVGSVMVAHKLIYKLQSE
jgi:hypothetical protein